MSSLRQDSLTGRWVIIAAQRQAVGAHLSGRTEPPNDRWLAGSSHRSAAPTTPESPSAENSLSQLLSQGPRSSPQSPSIRLRRGAGPI